MNVTQQAQRAYAPAQAHIRTPRAIESQLLSDITARMTRGAQNFPALVAAIHENRRLWATLAVEVADAANDLPEALRAQLFYLAEFTAHHSSKVLRGDADAGPLIDLNTAVIRGLNGQAVSQ